MVDGRRQILKVHLPGDLIGLPGLPVTEAPDTVTALTDVVLGHVSLISLGRLVQESPRVAAYFFWYRNKNDLY